MELLKAMAKRKSVRAFKADPVPEDALNTILAAGCAAPVGRGLYDSLHLTVISDRKILERISGAVAKMTNRPDDPLYGAPLLILVSSQEPPAPGLDYTNAGCIAENMQLAATGAGVGSVIIWGTALAVEAEPALKKDLGLPQGFKAVLSLALGLAASDDGSEKDMKIKIGLNRV